MRIPESNAETAWPRCGADPDRFVDTLRKAGPDPDTDAPAQKTPGQGTAPGTPNIPPSNPIAGLQPPDGQSPERSQDMGIETAAAEGDVEGSDTNQQALEDRFIALYEHLMEKQVSFKEAVEPFKTDNQNAAKG